MISVVLPTYNGEKYIKESVESIISQTYEDWELIVVDDCSVDNTLNIVKEYSLLDERIRVIHNDMNQRLPRSLNIGFETAMGDYLTWTSDDNIYDCHAFEVMKDYLCKNKNVPMVCCGSYLINEYGDIIGEDIKYDKTVMYFNNTVGACFLYKSYVKEEIGEYDEDLFGIEDYDYWLRVQNTYGVIGFVNQILYKYRVHKDNLTSTRFFDIKKKLNEYRCSRIDVLFDKLQNNPDLLCGLYFDMLVSGAVSSSLEARFISFVPILEFFCELEDDGIPVMLYGAGEYGIKAHGLLGDRVEYFVDSNSNKVGLYVDNVLVIDYERMLEEQKDYYVLISVDSDVVYDIACRLVNDKVIRISTYQQILRKRIGS